MKLINRHHIKKWAKWPSGRKRGPPPPCHFVSRQRLLGGSPRGRLWKRRRRIGGRPVPLPAAQQFSASSWRRRRRRRGPSGSSSDDDDIATTVWHAGPQSGPSSRTAAHGGAGELSRRPATRARRLRGPKYQLQLLLPTLTLMCLISILSDFQQPQDGLHPPKSHSANLCAQFSPHQISPPAITCYRNGGPPRAHEQQEESRSRTSTARDVNGDTNYDYMHGGGDGIFSQTQLNNTPECDTTRQHKLHFVLRNLLTWTLRAASGKLGSRRPLILFASANPDANRLYEDLMMTYNRIVRPVQNESDRVVVRLGLKLSQLIDVEWTDYKLKWDPSEYGGIEDINVPAEQIWLPDIALYNSAEGYFAVSIMTKAKVRFDGHVVWNPPAIFRSSCQIDITNFPFDSQNCHLKFGSWTFGTKLDLRHINDTKESIERGTDLSEYYQNVEWDIMQATARRNVITYNCCPNDFYPDVTFNFTLRRKPLFYTVNLILPCVGITILSFLVFYLPSDSGEKVTLTISILVSLIFFLSVLIETIPSTSLAMPLLGKYLVFTMILITLSVCATVCVLNIHFRTPSTHSMPPWIKRWCIDILPKYLFMNVPHYQSQQANVLPEQLIYLHNQAYLSQDSQALSSQQPNQKGTGMDPMTLLQNYLAPIPSGGAAKLVLGPNGEIPTTSTCGFDHSGGAGDNKLNANHKKKSKSKSKKASKSSNSCTVDLDVTKLSNSPAAALARAGSSSLFLPYLQSEAARRLQMQRSRSSDRENKSSSDCRITAAQSKEDTFDQSCDINDSGGFDCRYNGSQQRQARGIPTNSTVIKIQSPPSDSNSANTNANDSRGRKCSKSRKHRNDRPKSAGQFSFLNLFASKKTRTGRGSNGESSCILSNAGHDSDFRAATGERKDEEDDEYLHHQHFQARASICSTNLWRVGPTRRCSMAVPVNYPTYYQPMPHNNLPAAPGLYPINTVSGHIQHAHYHTHGDHSGTSDASSDLHDPRGAVGALASAAVSSSLVRPKKERTLIGGHEMQHLGTSLMRDTMADSSRASAQLVCNQQRQHSQIYGPSYGQMSSNFANYNSFNGAPDNMRVDPASNNVKNQQQQQQQQLSGQLRSSNSNGRLVNLNLLSSGRNQTNMSPSSHLIGSRPMQPGNQGFPVQYQQQFMPRSRSTDHRLSAIYSMDMPPTQQGPAPMNNPGSRNNQHTMNAPISFASAPHSALQHQQMQAGRYNGPVHQSLSIGRALGQAYVQRLQRQPAIYPTMVQIPPTASQRPSRAQQRGADWITAAPSHLMAPNQSSTNQINYLRDIGSSTIGQQESFEQMRRSRSQNSLDHRRLNQFVDLYNCEQCNRLRGNDTADANIRQRLNSLGCNKTQTMRPARLPVAQALSSQNSCSCQKWPIWSKNHTVRDTRTGAIHDIYKISGPVTKDSECSSCKIQAETSYPLQLAQGQQYPPLTTLGLMKLISEVDKAIQNAMFIAQHIDNLDEFESVKENWKFIAMVIDRIFLIVFLFACIVGTFAIFYMVPWYHYTRDQPIDLQLARLIALNLTGHGHPGGSEIYSRSCQDF